MQPVNPSVDYKPYISIIIPTYNRSKLLGITIESFIKQRYPKDKYEIIVADNNSSDNTKDIVAEWQSNSTVNIKYIFERRPGVHYARNSAAKIAVGEILYFTDDDMVADHNLLSEIIKPFEFDEEVGTATGRVLPKWESPPPPWLVKHCYNQFLSLNDPPEEFIISKKDCNVFSCHQAVRKTVFFEAGGFNPENTAGVWIGDGETGLNIKIKKLGYKYGFNGNSITHHIIPPDRMTQGYLNRRIGNAGFCDSYTEYRKNIPSNWGVVSNALRRTFVSAPVKVFGYLVLSLLRKDFGYLRFCSAYFNYYLKRNIYDVKIITSEGWRKMVLRSDWLSDDEED